MDKLNDDILMAIFKNFDLKTRLKAAQTCKRWSALLKDPHVLMDDVVEVYVDKWNLDQKPPNQPKRMKHSEPTQAEMVAAAFAHIGRCDQLKLGPLTAAMFLSERLMKDQLALFGKLLIFAKPWTDPTIVTCVQALPSSVTRFGIDCCKSDFSLSVLPHSVHLECLELQFDDLKEQNAPLALPDSLTTFKYSWFCRCISPESDFGAYTVGCSGATLHFLGNMQNCSLLEELELNSLCFWDECFLQFLRLIRDELPRLTRLSFCEVIFEFDDIDAEMKEFEQPSTLLPLQWIKFDRCVAYWWDAAILLVNVCDLKTLLIRMDQAVHWSLEESELEYVYELAPLLEQKNAVLELTINANDRPRDLEDIPVPPELISTLTKLELVSVHHSELLRPMFVGVSPKKLTEMKLHNCIGLGDAMLKVVAEWCLYLKKLSFKPHGCLGLNSITKQCWQPFLDYWNEREPGQLWIECLKPELAFGCFDLPDGQEKGVFEDGKQWMLFRKAFSSDGSDHLGKRLVIWQDGSDEAKMLVIADYQRNFDRSIRISVEDGNCILKEIRGERFEVDYSVCFQK